MNPDELAEARVPLIGHQDQLADAALLPPPIQQVGQPVNRHRAVERLAGLNKFVYVIIVIIVGDPDPLVRCMDPDPDPSLFS